MVECSPMARKTWVQSRVELYWRLKKWCLISPCLTLSIIRYVSRVKWSNPGQGVAYSPIPWCSSNWKGTLLGSPRLWSSTPWKQKQYLCANKLVLAHLGVKLPTSYSLTNHMYIYFNVCKQMTDIKLLLLHRNTWNLFTSCKQLINSK